MKKRLNFYLVTLCVKEEEEYVRVVLDYSMETLEEEIREECGTEWVNECKGLTIEKLGYLTEDNNLILERTPEGTSLSIAQLIDLLIA